MEGKNDKRLCTRIDRLFNEALKRYALINDGDRILIGLSGGKDSMALLQLMAQRSRIFKPRINVEAAFVKIKNIPYQCDENYLHDFSESLGINLHVLETSFDESTDHRHTHCFLCSWNRRKRLFSAAKELGCNKIALGHNKDDIIQTALMNLTFEGQFASMRPMMKMDKFDMTLIRPLCLIRESELKEYAEVQAFHKQMKNCPFEDASRRHDMKGIIERLEEMNPEFSYSCFHAIMKEEKEP